MITPDDLNSKWEELEAAGAPWGGKLVADFGSVPKHAVLSAVLNRGLVLQTTSSPPNYPEFDAVRVQKSKNENGLWHLLFELQNKSHKAEFSRLCADMINAAHGDAAEASTHDSMLQAYTDWLDFYKLSKKLTMESLRGLFGELVFLRDRLSTTLGLSNAVQCWVGPLGAPQDFVLPSFRAYEVKTIQPAGNSIKISSANQLDFEGVMSLVVYRMVASKDPNAGVNVHQLIESLVSKMENQVVHVFRDKLSALGLDLDDDLANSTYFNIQEPVFYDASKVNFPKVIASSLPAGVGNVKYEIAISSLAEFLGDARIE
jgi:hypothetical protein